MKYYHIYLKRIETKNYFNDGLLYEATIKNVITNWMYLGCVKGTKELLFYLTGKRTIRPAALRRFCNDHTTENPNPIFPVNSNYLYMITDDKGKALNAYNLLSNLCNNNSNNYLEKRNNYSYRKSPVPFTGKGRWFFGNYYRTFPKPEPEDKESIKEATDSCEHIKIKKHNIPDTWDDIPRTDVRDRSWKRHRPHQYKSNKPSYKKLSKVL